MTFQLRPYQSEIIAATRDALRSHRSVLIQLPTGGGKTALTASMIGTAAAKRRRSWFIVHRQELIEQSISTFLDVGIHHGVIAPGYPPDPLAPVQIASIDTVRRRLDKLPLPHFVAWDECHHVAAGSWAKVREAMKGAYHVGLSATPERLDGKGLRQWFSHMVQGPTTAWLIEHGFLAPYRAFAPSAPDLTGVKRRAGEYASEQLAEIMDTGTIIGDAVKHYRRLADKKRAIVFCVSIEHSQHVAAQFRAAGYMALHVDGEMHRAERRRAMQEFRAGSIDILTNVGLFGEGVDVPALDAVIMLRPTTSLAFYLQMVGRALRPSEGKSHALLLDHAGNIHRHGLPDDERAWSLDGRSKGPKKKDEEHVPIRQCPSCYYVHAPTPKCPHCGHVYERQARKVEQLDGDLREIDPSLLRDARMREQAAARTLDDLIALATARGYRNPEKWAAHVITWREAKQRGRRPNWRPHGGA